MRELTEIIAAFDGLCAEGRRSALATVIAVEGSAYRKPGARMLISSDGRTWGGVSGGCLEQDVARRARNVIDTGLAVRHVYDSAEEGGYGPGVTTGCGGAIEVFIQPLGGGEPGPIPLLRRVTRDRLAVTLCTPVSIGPSHGASAVDGFAERAAPLPPAVRRAALSAGERGVASSRLVAAEDDVEWLVERLIPPQALFLFGSGNDMQPLVGFAKLLGWHVSVIAARASGGLRDRFIAADAVHVVPSPDLPAFTAGIPEDAAVAVMTHDVGRDRAVLTALRGPYRYVGLLGPRHRTLKILAELPGAAVRGVGADRFFNPVGLDLGGSATPEEIALAVVAEIQMTLSGGSGRPLRLRGEEMSRGRMPVARSESVGIVEPSLPLSPGFTCPA